MTDNDEKHQPPPGWAERSHRFGPPPNRRGSPVTLIARLLIVVTILVVIAGVVASHAAGNWRRDDSGPPFGALLIVFLIVAAIVFAVRRLRRTFQPVARVIDATSRVADGDYSVRVEPSGPPDVREMVQAFNTMATRLESNELQRRRLFSDIAHELRTPLSIIQGTTEAVIDGVYPAEPENLAPILDQTRLMARLLGDLQTLANAEAGQLTLHLESFDLGMLLDEAAQSFAPAALRRGVTIRRAGAIRILATVDPSRLRQVVDNLIANAIRYTDEGGEVLLGLEDDHAEVRLTVSDTGRGMTQEDVARMFERFHKSVDSGGSGLGLAIARNLVEAHGGTIAAESAPSLGTRVTIRLPREAKRGRTRE